MEPITRAIETTGTVEDERHIALDQPLASLKDIEEKALTLKAEERARLVESLLETLHTHRSDIEAAWESEIQERVAAFDRGEMPSYPAEDVFAEARRLTR